MTRYKSGDKVVCQRACWPLVEGKTYTVRETLYDRIGKTQMLTLLEAPRDVLYGAGRFSASVVPENSPTAL